MRSLLRVMCLVFAALPGAAGCGTMDSPVGGSGEVKLELILVNQDFPWSIEPVVKRNSANAVSTLLTGGQLLTVPRLICNRGSGERISASPEWSPPGGTYPATAEGTRRGAVEGTHFQCGDTIRFEFRPINGSWQTRVFVNSVEIADG